MNHELTIATLREMADVMPRSSYQERVVLLTIVGATPETVTQGDAGKRVGLTAGGMTTIVERLVESGLIERVSGDDRRFVHLRSTRKGVKLISRSERKAGVVERAA